MLTRPRHGSARAQIALTGCACAIAGCASLDARPDVDRAAALVAGRSGAEPAWNAAWDDPSSAWDGASPLGSDAAVAAALHNNRALRRDVEMIAASRADLVQAHLLPNPIISLMYGFPTDRLGGSPFVAGAMQQLAWLWLRPARIDAAEAALRVRVLAVSDAALALVADVRRAHADVVLAERALALQEESIALIARSAEVLDRLFEVGEASGLDVNRVELDLLLARTDLRDRSAALDMARRRLLELMARADATAEWRTDGGLPDTDAATRLTERDVMEMAAALRLDVAAALASVEGRAAELGIARRERWPEVAVGASFERNHEGRRAVFPRVEIAPPIFDDGSAREAGRASALEQAEIEASGVLQSAFLEARTEWVRLNAHLDVIASYEESIVPLAESNLELARAAFQAGEIDLTVLLDAQRHLVAARLELVDRRGPAIASFVELERAVGGALVPDAIAAARRGEEPAS